MIITGILKNILSEISNSTRNYIHYAGDEISHEMKEISKKIFSPLRTTQTPPLHFEVSNLLREMKEIPEDKSLSTFIDLLREGTLIIPDRQIQNDITFSQVPKEAMLANSRDALRISYADFLKKLSSKDAAVAREYAVKFLNRTEIPEPPENELEFCISNVHPEEPWDSHIKIVETFHQKFSEMDIPPHIVDSI